MRLKTNAVLLTSILLLAAASPSLAQKSAPVVAARVAAVKKPKLDAEAQTIVDASAAVAPEFAADVLERLAESERVKEKALKIELLEKAFALAERSQLDVRQQVELGSAYNNDTYIGLTAFSNYTYLDRISRQGLMLLTLSRLDMKRARALFEQMQPPHIDPTPCTQALVADPDYYYSILARVAHDGYSDQEKTKGRHIELMAQAIRHATTHAQLWSASDLMSKQLTSEELAMLTPVFAQALDTVRGDERGFVGLTHYRVEAFAEVIKMLGVRQMRTEQLMLLRSLRQYLVDNFNGPRCADAIEKLDDKHPLPEAIAAFNTTFAKLLPAAKLKPIAPEELKDASTAETPEAHATMQSLQLNDLITSMNSLIEDGKPPSIEKRQTQKWKSSIDDILMKIDEWNDSSLSLEDAYMIKSDLYQSLLYFTAQGEQRTRIIERLIKHFETYSGKISPTLWADPVKKMLNGNFNTGVEDDCRLIIDDSQRLFIASDDATLHLYGLLEHYAPQDTRPLWERPEIMERAKQIEKEKQAEAEKQQDP